MCHTKIRRPASALLDKFLCPPGPGGPADASILEIYHLK